MLSKQKQALESARAAWHATCEEQPARTPCQAPRDLHKKTHTGTKGCIEIATTACDSSTSQPFNWSTANGQTQTNRLLWQRWHRQVHHFPKHTRRARADGPEDPDRRLRPQGRFHPAD